MRHRPARGTRRPAFTLALVAAVAAVLGGCGSGGGADGGSSPAEPVPSTPGTGTGTDPDASDPVPIDPFEPSGESGGGVQSPASTRPVSTSPVPTAPAPADPTPDGGSGGEVNGEQGPVQGVPGPAEPGSSEPGTTEPGTTEPGTTEPGSAEPGSAEPGSAEPSVAVSDDDSRIDTGLGSGVDARPAVPRPLAALQSGPLSGDDPGRWDCALPDNPTRERGIYTFDDSGGIFTYGDIGDESRYLAYTVAETDATTVLLSYITRDIQEELSQIVFDGPDAFTAYSTTDGRLQCARGGGTNVPDDDPATPEPPIVLALRNNTDAAGEFTDAWLCASAGGASSTIFYLFGERFGAYGFADESNEFTALLTIYGATGEDSIRIEYVDADGRAPEELTNILFDGPDRFSADSLYETSVRCLRSAA